MLSLVSHLTFKARRGDSRLTREEGRRGVFLKALWVAGLICHSLFPLCALALSQPSERGMQPLRALHVELAEASQWFAIRVDLTHNLSPSVYTNNSWLLDYKLTADKESS